MIDVDPTFLIDSVTSSFSPSFVEIFEPTPTIAEISTADTHLEAISGDKLSLKINDVFENPIDLGGIKEASPQGGSDMKLSIEAFEYGAFGLKATDKLVESRDDYALYQFNREGTDYVVADLHFPSNQPVAFQLDHLQPLLDNVMEHVHTGDTFVVMGDLNCLTVVGKEATDEQKLEVIYNQTEIVHFLNEYGKQLGIEFEVDFPDSSIAKERIEGDLTKNPQEQIKSGLTVRDTVISITGRYVGQEAMPQGDAVTSVHRAPIGQTTDIIPFELLGDHPFDHIIMHKNIDGLDLYFANVIESAGDKGFKESLYDQLPPNELTEQWTLDVYEQLAMTLEISLDEVHNLTELKDTLNSHPIQLQDLTSQEKTELVTKLACEFIDRVKHLDTTQSLFDYMPEGTKADWDSMIHNIVSSCVKKEGATAPFTVKLANNEFSRQIFGGFALGSEFENMQAELGASATRDLVESHQYTILMDLMKSDNTIVMLCENNKSNPVFTDEAKLPLLSF